ncbi:MAG: SRPBCC family protein [Bacteroidota bacterium]
MYISATHTVHLPLHEVFAFVANPANLPRWMGGLERPRLRTPLPLGAGSRFEATLMHEGTPTQVELVVTVFDPNHAFGVKVLTGPHRFESLITLHATDQGTRVTHTADAERDAHTRAVLSTLLGPFLRRRRARRVPPRVAQLVQTLRRAA